METRRQRAWAPLAWASGLWALAYVPWTQGVAFLGVLRGAPGAILLGLGVAVSVARAWRDRPPWPDPSPGRLFAASALVLVLVGQWYTSRLRVSGDEPHYLLMAQSLWREGDLDLRDNLAREDFREYTPGPVAAHWGTPRRDGRPFPAHSPGLPALLAPIYALGGRRACAAFLGLAAAALAVQVHALARRLTGDAGAALTAWAATLGAPVLFYSFLVYTEVPSALAVATALRLLVPAAGGGAGVLAALCASALPWLHVKMVPAAAALGLIALWRLRGGARWSFVAVAAAMAAAYLAYYHAIFGLASPLAIYGGGLPEEAAVGSPLRALVGLLLDRSFGLAWYAPVFVLAAAGLPALLRGRRPDALAAVLAGAAIALPWGTWRMWWGGQCPPGRFLVPLVPVLALAVAARVGEDGGTGRGVLRWRGALLATGYALALFMVARPGELMLLNRADRPTRVWVSLSGDVPIERYLPSLVAPTGAEWRVAALWLAALAFVIGLDWWGRRHEATDGLFRGLGLPIAVGCLVGLLVDFWARPVLSGGPPQGAWISSTAGAASGSSPAAPRRAHPASGRAPGLPRSTSPGGS